MQPEKGIVPLLNQSLKDQLTAINQYFLHARMFANWGLEELNEHEYKWSIKAMKHADRLIERVLFLEGLPNLQDLGKLLIGEDATEMLQNDLRLTMAGRSGLQQAVAQCETARDYVSRDLLTEILEAEEEHVDWLESQLWQIDHLGLPNYLQAMLDDD